MVNKRPPVTLEISPSSAGPAISSGCDGAKLKMPMGGNKLKDNEIADLKYWIQTMAAFWPTSASFTMDLISFSV